jgi:RNA polymerase sigma-70 factor (ECF subfamily)
MKEPITDTEDEQGVDSIGGFDVARLYAAEAKRMWRAVLAFSHDREIASDAVAEAFAQCIRRGDAVEQPRAWVWRAAFRIAAGALKERDRWGPITEEPSYEMPEGPTRLLSALRRLPANQRAALVLRHYAGYPTGEIAEILGVARATVRVHLSRGRRRLRNLLEEEADG